MISEKKALLRKQISEKINSLPDDYIIESDNGIFHAVTSLTVFNEARNILFYYSVKREPSTLEIVKVALQANKKVSFPLCYRGGIMNARVVESLEDLRPAMLGIPAPPESATIVPSNELDLIIVPALTYDMTGYRLGYGGGYYDRYLQSISASTVGIARERLLCEKLPFEMHDIAVHQVITEERAFCHLLPRK